MVKKGSQKKSSWARLCALRIGHIQAAFIWMGLTCDLVLLSVFSTEISSGNVGWGNGLIIASTIFAIVLATLQKAESQEWLSSSIVDLNEAYRTMPRTELTVRAISSLPEYFVGVLVARDVYKEGDMSKKDLEEPIRVLLKKLVEIVQSFDEANDNSVYAANVMTFYEPDIVNENEKIRSNIQFRGDVPISELKGVLNLELKLSYRSGRPTRYRDTDLKALALPVYNAVSEELESRLLPGAPRAYHLNDMIVVPDMQRLFEQIEKTDAYSKTKNEIKEFFEEAKIRSFISVPIEAMGNIDDGEEGTDIEPIGVVNIHTFDDGIARSGLAGEDTTLMGKSSIQLLFSLKPYILLLGELLRIYNGLDEAAVAGENS